MIAAPLSAEDRIQFCGRNHSPDELHVLSAQIESRMPADEVEQFWRDWAFASLSDRAAGAESWGRSRQCRRQADAGRGEQDLTHQASPPGDGGGL